MSPRLRSARVPHPFLLPGRADRLGDLLTAHSALDQIPDLLEACTTAARLCGCIPQSLRTVAASGNRPARMFTCQFTHPTARQSNGRVSFRKMTILELVTSVDFGRFDGLGLRCARGIATLQIFCTPGR
jgi:hypothetical protein